MNGARGRRARLLRGDGRPRLQEDLPGAPEHGAARRPRRPGHRRREAGLDAPRPPWPAPGTASRSTAAAWTRPPSPKLRSCSATWTATTPTPRPSRRCSRELGGAKRPVHYMAIPQGLFGLVGQPARRGRAAPQGRAPRRREAVRERPRLGARRSTPRSTSTSPRRTSSASTTTSARGRSRTWSSSASPTRSSSPSGTATTSRASRSPWPRASASQGRGGFYDKAGTIRDVVQNHLLQVVSNVAMEPPPRSHDAETIRAEKVKVLKGMPAIDPKEVVRGQFRGYRQEPGVAPDSQVETFVALRLHVNSWRWQGVPFFVRAGKCLPVTRTEVVVRLRRPPSIVEGVPLPHNHVRFRLSPDFVIALGHLDQGARRGAGGRGRSSSTSRTAAPATSTPTRSCSATRCAATRSASPARTTSRRPGASSTPPSRPGTPDPRVRAGDVGAEGGRRAGPRRLVRRPAVASAEPVFAVPKAPGRPAGTARPFGARERSGPRGTGRKSGPASRSGRSARDRRPRGPRASGTRARPLEGVGGGRLPPLAP